MSLIKKGRVWWIDITVDGRRIRKSTKQTDRALAQRIHDKVLGQIAEGKWFERLPGEDKTFKEMMEEYMTEHSMVKKKSWKRDKNSLDHLLPFFGNLTLARVTPAMISRYKSERLKEGTKPATLNRELALAKHAFNVAIGEWEWAKLNPFCRVKLERENNERDRILSHDEEQRLLEACPQWLSEIVLFALDTGAREGEILELRQNDVDFSLGVVTILQGKTGQYKTIPLTSRVLEILRGKAKVKHLFGDNDRLVFPSENGTRISDTNLGRAFRNVLKKARIEGLHFHDLRHTFASRCIQGGVDPYLVQKCLGHKDPRMMQRYSHHSIESLRSGIGALERLNGQRRSSDESNSAAI